MAKNETSGEEILDMLKELGRVTVTSQVYDSSLGARLDRWNVMVAMKGTGEIISFSHSDPHWAIRRLAEKMGIVDVE